MTLRFTIDMLPAEEGDCLWLTFGESGRRHHILIDGGRARTGELLRDRLRNLPRTERLDLVIVTHVDRDHVEGMLALVENNFHDVPVGDLWFNGREHLVAGIDAHGAKQGERLTKALRWHGIPWNHAFGGGAVAIEAAGQPRVLDPIAGMRLTLLSPTRAKLAALAPFWDAEITRAGLKGKAGRPEDAPGLERLGDVDLVKLAATRFAPDKTHANGTSIALLAEYGAKRVLLAADAHPDVLIASLQSLGGAAPVRLDAMKVPHHGSQKNLSNELVGAVDCPLFLISTNGAYFGHPDAEAIARIVLGSRLKPKLVFNYAPAAASFWDDTKQHADHAFDVAYLSADTGYQLDLMIGCVRR